MLKSSAAALLTLAAALPPAGSAHAAGEILITQAKALAGNVTPGDAAGFPVSLTRRGTYQLASTLIASANKAGIHILAPDVTVDLNGFTLHGNDVANNGVVAGQPNATIRNGTITGFRFDGVNASADFLIVDAMRIVLNGQDGVFCADGGQIRNSTVSSNGRQGISCTTARVQDNVVQSNAGVGIATSRGSVRGNFVDLNGSGGIVIVTGLAESNTVTANTGVGIYGSNFSALGNAVVGNTSWGVQSGVFYGFGNNFLVNNNGAALENSANARPLNPNGCDPACQ